MSEAKETKIVSAKPKIAAKATKPKPVKTLVLAAPKPKKHQPATKAKRTKKLVKPKSSWLEHLHGLTDAAPVQSRAWQSSLVKVLAEQYSKLTQLDTGTVASHDEFVKAMDKPLSVEAMNAISRSGVPSWVAQKLGGESAAELFQSFADKVSALPQVSKMESNSSDKEATFYDTIAHYGKDALRIGGSVLLEAAAGQVMTWLASYVPSVALYGSGNPRTELRDLEGIRDVVREPNSVPLTTHISKREIVGFRPANTPPDDRNKTWTNRPGRWTIVGDRARYIAIGTTAPATPVSLQPGGVMTRDNYYTVYPGPSYWTTPEDELPAWEQRMEETVDPSAVPTTNNPNITAATVTAIASSATGNTMPAMYMGPVSNLRQPQIRAMRFLDFNLYGADGVEIEGYQPLCDINNMSASVANPDGLGVFNEIPGFADVEPANYFIARGINLNPINLGGRLSNIAAQYNRYRFKNVEVCYCPAVGTATAGQFALSYVKDPGMYDSQPGGTYFDYAAITQTEPAPHTGPCIVAPYQRLMDDDGSGINVLRPILGNDDELYYCDEYAQSGSVADDRLINQGVIVGVNKTAGTVPSPGVNWGTCFIKWRIHLIDPVPLIRETGVLRMIKRNCGVEAYNQLIDALSMTATLFPTLRALGITENPSAGYGDLSELLTDLQRLGIAPQGAVYSTKLAPYWQWLEDQDQTDRLLITHNGIRNMRQATNDDKESKSCDCYTMVGSGKAPETVSRFCARHSTTETGPVVANSVGRTLKDSKQERR